MVEEGGSGRIAVGYVKTSPPHSGPPHSQRLRKEVYIAESGKRAGPPEAGLLCPDDQEKVKPLEMRVLGAGRTSTRCGSGGRSQPHVDFKDAERDIGRAKLGSDLSHQLH